MTLIPKIHHNISLSKWDLLHMEKIKTEKRRDVEEDEILLQKNPEEFTFQPNLKRNSSK